jgi:hypothetical protein
MLSPLTFSIWLESLGLMNVNEQGLFLLAITCHPFFFFFFFFTLGNATPHKLTYYYIRYNRI